VDDLACAVEYFKSLGIGTLHLMGSSMGALVSLLYASRRSTAITSLILIAAPVDIKAVFRSDSVVAGIDSYPESSSTTIDDVPIKNSFFMELYNLNMPDALKKIDAPALIIHGGRDAVVDPYNVDILEKYLVKSPKKVIIKDGDHSLTRDSDLEILSEAIVSWLKKFKKQ
jgi:pimeloyl-ACP methyl ester carboxylesterase